MKKNKKVIVKEQSKEYLVKNRNVLEIDLGKHRFLLGDIFDCLSKLDSLSVDIVFTSPPYNVGIEYENHYDKMNYSEYLGRLVR